MASVKPVSSQESLYFWIKCSWYQQGLYEHWLSIAYSSKTINGFWIFIPCPQFTSASTDILSMYKVHLLMQASERSDVPSRATRSTEGTSWSLQCLEGITWPDFRWHRLHTHAKKALPFSICQVLFSHLFKSKYRFSPTAVERKVE